MLITPYSWLWFQSFKPQSSMTLKLSYKGEYINFNDQFTTKCNYPSTKINWIIEYPNL